MGMGKDKKRSKGTCLQKIQCYNRSEEGRRMTLGIWIWLAVIVVCLIMALIAPKREGGKWFAIFRKGSKR